MSRFRRFVAFWVSEVSEVVYRRYSKLFYSSSSSSFHHYSHTHRNFPIYLCQTTSETSETQGARKYPDGEREMSVKRRLHLDSWPAEIEGLGQRHVVSFSLCANCSVGTWAVFGPWPLCWRCSTLGRGVHGDACGCSTCRPVHSDVCDCLTCHPEERT